MKIGKSKREKIVRRALKHVIFDLNEMIPLLAASSYPVRRQDGTQYDTPEEAKRALEEYCWALNTL
jgi:hypothetical protein